MKAYLYLFPSRTHVGADFHDVSYFANIPLL